MKNLKTWSALALAGVGALASFAAVIAAPAAETTSIPYPSNYRNWTHVKSMVIQPGHALHAQFGGIHHLYANEPAMSGYESGRFPNGAIIVFDLLEADTAGNAIGEGARKVVGVMQRDTKRFASTGGWGFEAFAGVSKTQRVVGANAAQSGPAQSRGFATSISASLRSISIPKCA